MPKHGERIALGGWGGVTPVVRHSLRYVAKTPRQRKEESGVPKTAHMPWTLVSFCCMWNSAGSLLFRAPLGVLQFVWRTALGTVDEAWLSMHCYNRSAGILVC